MEYIQTCSGIYIYHKTQTESEVLDWQVSEVDSIICNSKRELNTSNAFQVNDDKNDRKI